MTRRLFVFTATRRRTTGQLADGIQYVVYSDEGGTVPADIAATVGGSSILGSSVTTADIDGLGLAAARFYGPPDGQDTLWLRCVDDDSLGVQELKADPDSRLDALEAQRVDVSGLTTAQTQDAIDDAPAGSTVYFGPGLHYLGPLTLKSEVRYAGAGMDATVLVLDGGSDDNLFGNALGGLTQVEISDLTIDGNRSNQSSDSYAISFPVFARSAVRRVRTKNTYSAGINLFNCTDCVVEQCEISDTGTAGGDQPGINVSGGTRIRLLGNQVNSVAGTGIGCGSSSIDLEITGNLIRDAGFIGIALGNSTCSAVTGNTISGCVDNGIDVGSGTEITVSGNMIRACGGGIIGDGAGRCAVTGNNVSSTAGTDLGGLGVGIGFVASSAKRGVVITGNTVYLAYGHGILLDGVSDSAIVGNVVQDSCEGLSAGSANGIQITATLADAKNILVTGNRCYDTRGTKKQDYGLGITSGAGTAGACRIVGNDFATNRTGTINDGGSATSYALSNNDATASTIPVELRVRDIASGFPGLRIYNAAGAQFGSFVTQTSTGHMFFEYGGGTGDVAWLADSGGSEQLRLFRDGGLQLPERADPSAPASNKAIIYVRDNGSGKTQVVARFPTGAVQVIATEP